MRLFLCEKPSQGNDIAKVLGARQRGAGYLKNDNVIVTWCIGHLLETAPPESYDEAYKRWSLEHLPIVPSDWKMVVKPKTNVQFNTVKKLLKKASELVIATDADREGEMIARELVDYCGYKGKISRLWLSALNEASIRKALNELKPGSATESMYYSALTRSRSDWLIGMNLSRLFTLVAKQGGYDGVLSVGRVQTPTLNLVVKRDLEIANFVSKPYWSVNAVLNANGSNFNAQWQPGDELVDEAGRCIKMAAAQQAVTEIKQRTFATVNSVETERIKEAQPLLFDLGTLQQVCSSKFGLGAQETLDIAQALYENYKATTYPRTDCGYLPESMQAEIPAVLKAVVQSDPSLSQLMSSLDTTIRSRAWNDKKISAHHGIIPTLEPTNLAAMSEKELAVYKLIRSYYLAQFMPAHEYDKTVVMLSCGKHQLKANGKQIIKQGWHQAIRPEKDTNEGADSKSQVLPELSQGRQCQVNGVELKELKTMPPKPYTEGELIRAMKGIAKFVSDPRLKQKLKETTGLGTEATRAGIIKGLLQRKYLVTKNKSVHATDAAFKLISAVPPAIIDPGMTALWEQALESIEKGEMSMDTFLSKQTQWLSQLIQQYSNSVLTIANTGPKCPECSGPMRIVDGKFSQFYACKRYPECKGSISGDSFKKLFRKGKTK